MSRTETITGGRAATTGIIPGKYALSVGNPNTHRAGGYRWRQLTDLARLESGHTPSRKVAEYWMGNIPWIGIRDATRNHGRKIFRTNESVTEEGINNSSARVLPADTVCLSRTASVGYVVTMGVPMATSQDFVNWVCGPELSPLYLHYILMAEQESIRRFAHGSVHPTLYYPEAKALHVYVPDRSAQDAVVALLSALDDKLGLNERIVATADALLAGLYTASVAGDSQTVQLSSTAEFINGRAFTKDATGSGRMVVRIAEINSGPGGSTVYNDIDVPEVHLVRPGDVLFAWSGSLTVARWYRPEAIINQHIFKVIPMLGYSRWLCFVLVSSALAKFRGIAADKATTMGHIQRHHLDELVEVPSGTELARLEKQALPVWERALAAEVENLQLAALRDTLLPKLMSGELRVRDAEQIVGDAV